MAKRISQNAHNIDLGTIRKIAVLSDKIIEKTIHNRLQAFITFT